MATLTRDRMRPADVRPNGSTKPRRRFRPLAPALVAGLAMVGVSFVVFLELEPTSPTVGPALALSQPVAAGHAITGADLKVVRAGAKGLSLVPASQEAQVVGQAATTDLAAGSLLVPADLTTTVGPPLGQAVVGLALKSGSFPAEVGPGQSVAVVATAASSSAPSSPANPAPSPAGTSTGAPSLLAQGRVYSVSSDPSTGEAHISLAVPANAAMSVAEAGAEGRVDLIWVQP